MSSPPSTQPGDSSEVNELRALMKGLREENARLRESRGELWGSSVDSEQAQRAALNLMEDAVAAETGWRASEEKYRTLFESIDEGICLLELICDEEGQRIVDYRFHEVNNVFERQMGIQHARGKLASEVGLDGDADLLKTYAQALQKGQSSRVESFSSQSGRWFSVFAARIGEAGSRLICAVFDDITQQQADQARLAAAEERLRLIVDSALEHAIIAMDLERRVTNWNPGAEQILGFTRQEMLGQTADVIFTPEDLAAGQPEKEKEEALTKGRANDNRWTQRKDGSRFWANGAMLPMRSRSGGEIVGLVKILRDETAMRQAQQALEDSREQLWEALQENEKARIEIEAASAAKDRFLAMLSHELRTPLTPILTATHVLERMPNLSAEVRETIKMIRRNLKIEAQFIDDLLDVTRITNSKFEIMREPLDVHEAVQQAIEISQGDIQGKELRLAVALEAQNHRLLGDFARLQQAFWNLLKNAAKFTSTGGQIRVRSWNEGGNLFVAVSDNGIGIDEAALENIFEAFTQGSPDIPRKFGGLGLGLAIAKAAVEAHGGKIYVDSGGENAGATFTISLPVCLSAP